MLFENKKRNEQLRMPNDQRGGEEMKLQPKKKREITLIIFPSCIFAGMVKKKGWTLSF